MLLTLALPLVHGQIVRTEIRNLAMSLPGLSLQFSPGWMTSDLVVEWIGETGVSLHAQGRVVHAWRMPSVDLHVSPNGLNDGLCDWPSGADFSANTQLGGMRSILSTQVRFALPRWEVALPSGYMCRIGDVALRGRYRRDRLSLVVSFGQLDCGGGTVELLGEHVRIATHLHGRDCWSERARCTLATVVAVDQLDWNEGGWASRARGLGLRVDADVRLSERTRSDVAADHLPRQGVVQLAGDMALWVRRLENRSIPYVVFDGLRVAMQLDWSLVREPSGWTGAGWVEGDFAAASNYGPITADWRPVSDTEATPNSVLSLRLHLPTGVWRWWQRFGERLLTRLDARDVVSADAKMTEVVLALPSDERIVWQARERAEASVQ